MDRRQREQEEAFQLRRDWRASDAVALSFDPEYRQVNKIRFERQAEHADPARLIVVDEADRLKMASLEPGALWADETSLTGEGSVWC